MKKIILISAILASFPLVIKADELNNEIEKGKTIYELKDNNGSTILTNKASKFANLKIEKQTYYPPNNSWNVNCTKDRFNGTKACTIDKYYKDIIVLYRNGKYSVLIGRNHYPDTQSAIKIDNNSTIYGFEGSSNTPLKVIEQLKNGKVAYTRYQEWPYKYNIDSEVDLDGFSKALDEMKKQYRDL